MAVGTRSLLEVVSGYIEKNAVEGTGPRLSAGAQAMLTMNDGQFRGFIPIGSIRHPVSNGPAEVLHQARQETLRRTLLKAQGSDSDIRPAQI